METHRDGWRSRPGTPAPGTRLCALAEIADPGAKGFVFGGGVERFDLVVVRRNALLRGYVNECPHAFTTLEFRPDQFLLKDGTRLLCATHGAQFELEDGYCVWGPCLGESLTPVPIAVDGEIVYIGPD